jgi:hypothetical protein
MARFIRMETGIAMDGHINRYDGEPLEPQGVIDSVKELLEGKQKDLDVSEAEAKEMVYHYLRTHSLEKLRPVKLTQEAANGKGEPTWNVEIAERVTGKPGATMVIGTKTGTTHSFTKAE